MQNWLPWKIVSNHLGQEMKHHKSILFDEFMHLSIENFAPILEFRTYNAKCG